MVTAAIWWRGQRSVSAAGEVARSSSSTSSKSLFNRTSHWTSVMTASVFDGESRRKQQERSVRYDVQLVELGRESTSSVGVTSRCEVVKLRFGEIKSKNIECLHTQRCSMQVTQAARRRGGVSMDGDANPERPARKKANGGGAKRSALLMQI